MSTLTVKSSPRPPLAVCGEFQGKPYNLVRWQRCLCACGQWQIVKKYELV